MICSIGISSASKGKTVHSTNILQALNVRKIVNNLSAKCLTFYYSVFSNETPATKLNRFLLSRYVTSGRLIPGTLISKLVRDGYSPMSVVFNKPCTYKSSPTNCGITESLQNLLYILNENFIKPYSEEKFILYILTKFKLYTYLFILYYCECICLCFIMFYRVLSHLLVYALLFPMCSKSLVQYEKVMYMYL